MQSGEVDPVGARATLKVDLRLISATHRNLIELVKDGKFREDLFYRLNVFPIFVPPLRDRRDDIPHLVSHFMARVTSAGAAERIPAISEDALTMLKAYDWPGNIRQLENAVLRASVLCDGTMLTRDDFPQIKAQMDGIVLSTDSGSEAAAAIFPPREDQPSRAAVAAGPIAAPDPQAGTAAPGAVRALDDRGEVRTLADIELEMIKFAIEHYQGQMSEVARRLGIGRSTLYRKLKEYGIEPDETKADRLAS